MSAKSEKKPVAKKTEKTPLPRLRSEVCVKTAAKRRVSGFSEAAKTVTVDTRIRRLIADGDLIIAVADKA